MKCFTKIVTSIAFGFFTATNAFAQDAYADLAQIMTTQQIKAARLMISGDVMKKTMATMRTMIASTSPETSTAFDAKIEPAFDKYMRTMQLGLTSDESQKFMHKTIDGALRKVYSLDEASAQLAFFRTPAGASIAAKSGDIAVEMALAMPQLMQRIAAPAMRDFMEEMKALDVLK